MLERGGGGGSGLEFICGIERRGGCNSMGQSSRSVLRSDPACSSSCGQASILEQRDLHFEKVEVTQPSGRFGITATFWSSLKYLNVLSFHLTVGFVALLGCFRLILGCYWAAATQRPVLIPDPSVVMASSLTSTGRADEMMG